MKKILVVLLVTVILLTTINITPEFIQSVNAADPNLGPSYIYSEDGLWVLFKKDDGKIVLYDYQGDEQNVTVPSMIDGYLITEIGDEHHEVFYNKGGQTLTFHDTVKVFNNYALTGNNFKRINMPRNVEFLGIRLFANSENLEYVKLPENIIEIPCMAFKNCSSLEYVYLSDNIEIIRSNAFQDCISLKRVKLPESVTTIESCAFECSSLEGLVIPATTVNIAHYICDPDAENLTIYGYTGSAAEQNANEWDIKFSPIEGAYAYLDPFAAAESSYQVIVLDKSTKLPIEGAIVRITASSLGTIMKTTSSSGVATFTLSSNFTGTCIADVLITKNDYYRLSTKIIVKKNKFETKYLQQNDGGLHILDFIRVSNGNDLLHKRNIFYAGDEDNTSEQYIMHCGAPDSSPLEYRIMQNQEIIATSTTGSFNIDFSQILMPDEKTFIQVVNADGLASEWEETGVTILPIVDKTVVTDEPVDLNLGSKESVDMSEFGEGFELFAGKKLTVGFSGPVPIQFQYNNDGSFDAYIGGGIAVDEAKDAIESFKYLNNLGKINPYYFQDFYEKGFKKQFGGDVCYADASVLGYGKGYVKDGKMTFESMNVLLILELDATYTWQMFTPTIPPIPWYVYVGAGAELSVVLDVLFDNENDQHLVGDLSLDLYFSAGVGIGFAHVLGVAGEGKIYGNYNIDYGDFVHRLTAGASFSLKFDIVLFHESVELLATEKKFFDKPMHGVSSTAQSSSNNQTLASSAYNTDNFSVSQRNNSLVNLQSTTTSYADNISVVEENTFQNAMPKMINHNGTPYIFWLADDTTRNVQDRTMLVYSKKVNGVWSAPIAIEDDDTADGFFNVASDEDGIYIVWQDSKIQFPADLSMETFFEQAEISFAYLDTATNAITVQNITSNTYMDTVPAICIYIGLGTSKKGTGYIAWISNDENNIFLNSGTNTVYRAPIDNGAVGNAETIYTTTKPITELNAGLIGGVKCVAFIVDEDNNIETLEDREIYMKTNGDVYNFTNNDVFDSNVKFGNVGRYSNYMFYYSDSNIYCLKSFYFDPEKISHEEIPTDNFEVINGYDAKVIWSEPIAKDGETYQAIYAMNHSYKFSKAYLMTEIDSLSTLPTGYHDRDNELTELCYLNPASDYMDLITETHSAKTEFKIVDVAYPDMKVTTILSHLYTYIQNTGSTDIASYDIQIYRNNELYYSFSDDKVIKMCGIAAVQIGSNTGFNIPLDSTIADTYRVELTCSDGNTEYHDSYEFNIVYPDIEIELERGFDDGDDLLTVTATNNILIDTEGTLIVKENNEEGKILKRIELGTINKETITCTVLNLSEIMSRTDADMLYVVVESSKGDTDISNNNEKIYVRDEANGEAGFKPIEVSYEASNCTNATANDGIITFTATYGSGNYEYSIDHGITWQTINVFNNLSFGSYEVIVRDFENQGDMFIETISLISEPIQSITLDNLDTEYYNAASGITLSATSVDGYGDAGTDETVQYKFYYSTDSGTTWVECADWDGNEISFIPPSDGNYMFYVAGQAVGSTVTVDSTYSTVVTLHLGEEPIQSVTINNPDAEYYNASNGIILSATSIDENGNAGTDTTVQYKFYYSTNSGTTWTECADWGGHEITFTPSTDGDYIFYVSGRAIESTATVDSTYSTVTTLHLEEKAIQSVTINNPDSEYYNASSGITINAASIDGYGNAGTDTTIQYKFYYSTDSGSTWTECADWGGHEITFTPSLDGNYTFYVSGRAIGSTVTVDSAYSTATALHLEEKAIQSVTINNPDAEYYNASNGIILSATSIDENGNAGTDTTVQYKFYYSTNSGTTWTECADWGGHEITFTPSLDGNYTFYVSGRAIGSTVTVDSAYSTATALHLGSQP